MTLRHYEIAEFGGRRVKMSPLSRGVATLIVFRGFHETPKV